MSAEQEAELLQGMGDAAFRLHVRDWIETSYPKDKRYIEGRPRFAVSRFWFEMLAEKGWLAPGWPTRYGGLGLSGGKQLILSEELDRFGCVKIQESGITMVGPLLIAHGTDEQRDHFLPAILRGEHIWCQGYSEPGAGSDLASLRTRADRVEQGWKIDGQKTWTSFGEDANWIFLLARTDQTAKPQRGISFFLIPMDAPGVSIRPILTLDLQHEFCETFLDGVIVPDDRLVGEVNAGWGIAKALLGFERIFLGMPKQAGSALAMLRRLADLHHLWHVEDFITAYDTLLLDLEDHSLLFEVCADRMRNDLSFDIEVSRLKIHQADLFQRITDIALAFGGPEATLLHPTHEGIAPSSQFLRARPATIYGGSSEIQRDILAKASLSLPS